MRKDDERLKPEDVCLIVRTVTQCNLRCLYCYAALLHSRSNRIALETVENALTGCTEAFGDVSVCWQGGEPLLAGKAWFAEALEMAGGFGVRSFVQTNGLLLDDEWFDLFDAYGVKVSVSADGPLTDRRFPNGKSSWPVLAEKLRYFKGQGRQFGIISVVNSSVARDPDAYLDAMSEVAASSARTNRYSLVEGQHGQSPSIEDEISFWRRLWERYPELRSKIQLKSLDEALFAHCNGFHTVCTHSPEVCRKILALEVDGGVFPCSRLLGSTGWSLGNVNDPDFDFSSAQHASIRKKSRTLHEECSSCSSYAQCQGGCALERPPVQPGVCSYREALFVPAAKVSEGIRRKLAAKETEFSCNFAGADIKVSVDRSLLAAFQPMVKVLKPSTSAPTTECHLAPGETEKLVRDSERSRIDITTSMISATHLRLWLGLARHLLDDEAVLLHAGLTRVQGKHIVLAGASGTGKTALCAGIGDVIEDDVLLLKNGRAFCLGKGFRTVLKAGEKRLVPTNGATSAAVDLIVVLKQRPAQQLSLSRVPLEDSGLWGQTPDLPPPAAAHYSEKRGQEVMRAFRDVPTYVMSPTLDIEKSIIALRRLVGALDSWPR